jgi:hypothetical protein
MTLIVFPHASVNVRSHSDISLLIGLASQDIDYKDSFFSVHALSLRPVG